jgi:pimeloyl-ACP methyl ester carboxylesterase
MLLHSLIIGEGQPMIILHGFLGMSDNWKTMAKRFSELGFEVHLVDQRNHGRSFHTKSFNYELLVEDLYQYCKHYHLKNAILLGHSMGGKTAMLFAVNYPNLVSNLIVADIAPRYYPVHHHEIMEGLLALDFNEIKTRKEADRTLATYVQDFSMRQFLLKNVYWQEKGRLGLRINLRDLNANLEEIGKAYPTDLHYEKPALFLKGDQSEYISEADEKLIQTEFTNAKIITIKKAGHWLHAENPNDFFEAIKDFIS